MCIYIENKLIHVLSTGRGLQLSPKNPELLIFLLIPVIIVTFVTSN
jgi:hypothetical protein